MDSSGKAPMRDAPLDDGHRAKVAATRTASSKADPPASSNFEYDDNEWDIGIGDLIIDLDADIEKTNEKVSGGGAGAGTGGGMSSAANSTGKQAGGGKMTVEHSATVDKGLKMKIKRTKPGTKTSEAKHEIVKTGELNGGEVVDGLKGGKQQQQQLQQQPHPVTTTPATPLVATAGSVNNVAPAVPAPANNGSKRGSSGHRRDKVREKHGGDKVVVGKPTPLVIPTTTASTPLTVTPDVNGVVKSPSGTPTSLTPAAAAAVATATAVTTVVNNQTVAAPQAPPPPPPPPPPPSVAVQSAPPQRVLFPVAVGPGSCPPTPQAAPVNVPGPPPPPSPVTPVTALIPLVVVPVALPVPPVAAVPTAVAAVKVEPAAKMVASPLAVEEPRAESPTPPPAKKAKISPSDPKDVTDVCVGTSVGTITEPDCLGPCEPGTSVTLEGIVWHETEGGVLVVNVTWRGKTYVGTLLDCTQHDWAPPRFCDSPTSDLDARVPKGRGKRGRAAAAAAAAASASTNQAAGDLSNFTETRSSVHSKLRNGGAKGRRGGGTAGGTNGNPPLTGGAGSPTPFVPPRPEPTKRKNRSPDEEATPGKKNKGAPTSTSTASGSPPVSPVLLECPEPNCSKKYKHINGLKYHQSHAHGSADDDDTKESMSDTEESNIEAPSPAAMPVKSPEKVPDRKEESVPSPVAPTVMQLPVTEPAVGLPAAAKCGMPLSPALQSISSPVPIQQPLAVPIQPTVPTNALPTSTPPQTPQELVPIQAPVQSVPFPNPEVKNVLKPGVLQFGPPSEEFPAGLFSGNKQQLPPTTVAAVPPTVRILNVANLAIAPSQPPQQPQPLLQPLPLMQQQQQQQQQQVPSILHQPQVVQPVVKPAQFKVKPTAALMPEEKKDRSKLQGHKKKSRKSPAGSPHPPDQPQFGMDQSGREDVQSPAYSDISDDAAPMLESEASDIKGKCLEGVDKKVEVNQGPSPHAMSHYNMYPFYGQPPYLVPSVQQEGKTKEGGNKLMDIKPGDKEKKDGGINVGDYQQQKMMQQHYYTYPYGPSYPYNIEPSYPLVMPTEEKGKDMLKEEASPSPNDLGKVAAPLPSPIQVPNPLKVKGEPGVGLKEKHQNENHQILKESIEMKNQMSPYLYSRQQQQQQQQQHQHQEDMRRYYMYPDQQQQRRKEPQGPPELPPKPSSSLQKPTLSSPSHKHRDKGSDEKKEEKPMKQEGVKPTMETQGPPPPPTSQYAYIHPTYMQSPHYGALPFDPGHPMYRGINPMLVPGPYSNNPYLHHQLPRYHAPEDLSRSPSGQTKALDLLQHHASQYYSSHKIHELQERALKSPTPKTPTSNPSPSAVGPSPGPPPGPVPQGPPSASPSGPGGPALPGKQQAASDGKEGRSPPPQRHVHTHHHTHVGLGYPILAGQYPAPYGGKPMVRP